MAKKKKHKGHYCRICGEYKANEKFSGKGHAQHICKTCMYHSNDKEPLQSENIAFADYEIESGDMDYDMFNPDIDIMPPVDPERKRFKKLNREEKAALKSLWTDIVESYWEDEHLIPIGEAYSRLKKEIISIFAEEGEIMLVDDNELKTVLRPLNAIISLCFLVLAFIVVGFRSRLRRDCLVEH